MLTISQAQTVLNLNGFPVGSVDGIAGPATRAGTTRFQQAYAWQPLTIDGILTATTLLALERAPFLSEHFTTNELKSKGDGTCYIRREILWRLESLRIWTDSPIPLVSAWRDVKHNASVGGASISLHTYAEKKRLRRRYELGGTAVDVSRHLGLKLFDVLALELFAGVGYLMKSQLVTHIDARDSVGRGSVTNPTTWRYQE